MLLSLHVKNLALIEEEEVTFTDGLNILTGETGAGKSIIIGSINMALGARADRNVIRTGTDSPGMQKVPSRKKRISFPKKRIPSRKKTTPSRKKIIPCLKIFGKISSSSSARFCPLEASAPSAARPLHSNSSGKWESC